MKVVWMALAVVYLVFAVLGSLATTDGAFDYDGAEKPWSPARARALAYVLSWTWPIAIPVLLVFAWLEGRGDYPWRKGGGS